MKFNLLWMTLFLCIQAQATDKLQYYFNHNELTSYKESYRGIYRQGDNFEALIINEINKAKKTIDMAIHDLNVPGIAKALIERKKAGVKVRLILENVNNREFKRISSNETNTLDERSKNRYLEKIALIDINKDGLISDRELLERDTITMLNHHKVPKIDDTYDGSHGSGIMHHKFFVVDNNVVVQSSANFTLSDFQGDLLSPKSRGNQNALVIIRDYNIAQIFNEEFLEMWNFKFGPQKRHRQAKTFKVDDSQITVKFSSDSSKINYENTTNGLIRQTLLSAKKSIDLALFVFSEQDLVNSIQERSLRGVKIQALVEPSFAYREYSELLDMMGLELQDVTCMYQPRNNPWKYPSKRVGVPNLPNGDMLHHKFGVIDESKVIFGSHNWSDAANSINDEALLVIESSQAGKEFKREHNRLMRDAILGPSANLLKKIEKRSSECNGL